LPRRAFLGTQLQQVNDSIAQFHKLKQPKGVLVLMVVAGSSAEAMGIEANDLVINVENKEVNSPAELINAIGKYRSGDEIAITIMRDGESLNKSGILKPLPHETSDHADVIYDEVPFDGGHIRTIIHRPRVNGKVPAVFFIQGYTCTSIDRMQADHPYKKLLDGLVEQGFAIVKTEKAGIGDSQNDRNCTESTLFDEIDLFSESYNNLKKYDFIDQDNIFIFGHSMGGIAAPLLKTDIAPKGIAVYGTVIRPWFEYFLEHSRIQKFIMGWDYLENEQQHEAALKFFYRLMVEKQSPAQLVQDPSVKEFMEQRWSYDGSEMLLGRHYTFWQQLQETKLFNAWAHTPAFVLSIWGEGDFVAFNPYEHQLIADVVNRYNPGKAKYLSFPNIDHSFIRVENQEHAVKVRNDWEYNAQNFNYDIVTVLSQWMNDVQSTSETP
jgi:uncharacterized protein